MKKVQHRSRAALPLGRRCILENFEYGINHRFDHQIPKQPVAQGKNQKARKSRSHIGMPVGG
ncbi:hypothetical protein T01_1551 [Trichinella spiralis]|uniref:Uncharacterized protein n=1 Tax=Trichinella spiralis TaxID=6334 RepID=A0A0V0ZDD5_TRISP|nr:hypothetical protein T01_1551 [Trichinella spiralis]